MDSSELAELDAAVARAQGWKVVNFSEGRDGVYSVPDDPHSFVGYLQPECPPPWFRPSTDWSQGGPIIERERIAIHYGYAEVSLFKWDESWMAGYNLTIDHWDYGGETGSESSLSLDYQSIGPTPLIAAMRAFVASKK